jgi:hypothetical protein
MGDFTGYQKTSTAYDNAEAHVDSVKFGRWQHLSARTYYLLHLLGKRRLKRQVSPKGSTPIYQNYTASN